MRDLGMLVWVAIVFVGVVSSIVRSSRAQHSAGPSSPGTRAAALAPSAARPAPQPVAAAGPALRRSRPIAAAAPQQPLAVMEPGGGALLDLTLEVPTARPARARWLFGGRDAVVRAVVAAEILGKPKALRDEYTGVDQ